MRIGAAHLLVGVVLVEVEADVSRVRVPDHGYPGQSGADRKSAGQPVGEVQDGAECLVVAAGQVENNGHVHLTTARCRTKKSKVRLYYSVL